MTGLASNTDTNAFLVFSNYPSSNLSIPYIAPAAPPPPPKIRIPTAYCTATHEPTHPPHHPILSNVNQIVLLPQTLSPLSLFLPPLLTSSRNIPQLPPNPTNPHPQSTSYIPSPPLPHPKPHPGQRLHITHPPPTRTSTSTSAPISNQRLRQQCPNLIRLDHHHHHHPRHRCYISEANHEATIIALRLIPFSLPPFLPPFLPSSLPPSLPPSLPFSSCYCSYHRTNTAYISSSSLGAYG